MMQMQCLPVIASNCLFVSLTSKQTCSRGSVALEISLGSLVLIFPCGLFGVATFAAAYRTGGVTSFAEMLMTLLMDLSHFTRMNS